MQAQKQLQLAQRSCMWPRLAPFPHRYSIIFDERSLGDYNLGKSYTTRKSLPAYLVLLLHSSTNTFQVYATLWVFQIN